MTGRCVTAGTPFGSLIQGAGAGAVALVVLGAALAAGVLLGAVDVGVDGLVGVWALAASVAAARVRTRTKRFIAEQISD